jgi:hypothetical protein
MKRLFLFLSVTVTAEIPASWLRAIPEEPLAITGIDVVRFRAADLHGFRRLDVPLEDTDSIQYMVHVEVYNGDFYLLRINETAWKEIGEDYILAPLDKETAVLGRTTAVIAAIERMRATQETIAPIRALADRFDAWAYTPRAIRERTKGIAPQIQRFEAELLESIGAVRAGVRFGASIEARIEVDTKSPDQASALAVLGKLAPGWIQNRDALVELSFIDAIERFTTWAEGATAIAEVTIPASAVRRENEELR